MHGANIMTGKATAILLSVFHRRAIAGIHVCAHQHDEESIIITRNQQQFILLSIIEVPERNAWYPWYVLLVCTGEVDQ